MLTLRGSSKNLPVITDFFAHWFSPFILEVSFDAGPLARVACVRVAVLVKLLTSSLNLGESVPE